MIQPRLGAKQRRGLLLKYLLCVVESHQIHRETTEVGTDSWKISYDSIKYWLDHAYGELLQRRRQTYVGHIYKFQIPNSWYLVTVTHGPLASPYPHANNR